MRKSNPKTCVMDQSTIEVLNIENFFILLSGEMLKERGGTEGIHF